MTFRSEAPAEIRRRRGPLKAVMLATVAALLLSCKMVRPPQPPPPPVPVTVRCEGADRVTRNHDRLEVHRVVDACTVARCEGADWVVRTRDGQPVARAPFVRRCLPREPVVVAPPRPPDLLRFGLSYR